MYNQQPPYNPNQPPSFWQPDGPPPQYPNNPPRSPYPSFTGQPPDYNTFASPRSFAGPPPQPPRKRVIGKQTALGCGCLTVVALVVIIAVASILHGSSPSPASNPTPVVAHAASTSVATAIPTHSTGSGSARIGAVLDAFVARYGQPNAHSDLTNHSYDFSLYGTGKSDLTVTTLYNTHVDAVLYGAPPDHYWSKSETLAACRAFLPSDAVYQRQMTVLDTQGNPMDEQLVYESPSIGKLFPASAFNDENGNPAKPGTIGLILSHWTPTSYLQCTVQVGLESK